MKRFIAVLVCIFMLVSLLPAFAFAEEGGNDPIEATPTPTVETTPEQTKDTTTMPTSAPTQPVEEQQLTSTGAPENTGTSYTVRVSASSTEGGTVTGGGTYNSGESATVTATANPGYKFVKWTENGGDVSTNQSYVFAVTKNRALVAEFTKTEVELKYTVTVNGGSGSAEYAENASVAITANEPETGKQFKEWTGAEGLNFTSGSKNSAEATFAMPAKAVALTATYENIMANTLLSIAVTTLPAKTEYTEGELFDAADIGVTATYADGNGGTTTKLITEYTCTPNVALTTSNASITISYTEGEITKTAELPIKVNPAAKEQTSTSLAASYSKVPRGTIVTFTAHVKDNAGQFVPSNAVKLYINGSLYNVDPEYSAPSSGATWKIHVTETNGFKPGENSIVAVYGGSEQYAPSSSATVKLTVVSPCTPKPSCKPSHYCCGQNHFSGKCVTVRSGEDVTFKVELGCNETCQWYIDKGDGCGFVKIEGATNPRLTVKDVTRRQDGYRYRCIVRNCCDVVGKPIFTLNVASGQLYTPKTGGNGAITLVAGCAALAALILVGGRRSRREG